MHRQRATTSFLYCVMRHRLFAPALFLLLLLILHESFKLELVKSSAKDVKGVGVSCAHGISSAQELRAFGISSVKASGLQFTDKFMWHEYHVPYFKYLFQVSDVACRPPGYPVRIFEIGIGTQPRTGASAVFWRALFGPAAVIDVMELEETEATKVFLSKYPVTSDSRIVNNLFYGDQTKKADLSKVIQHAQDIGLYDVVIDDGGHTSACIITTIEEVLLTMVKPGGILVIEDMHTFMSNQYISDSPPGGHHASFFKELLEDQLRLAVKAGGSFLNHPKLSMEISSVDCMSELCIITRRESNHDDEWHRIYGDCVGVGRCDCGVLAEDEGRCIPE